MTPNADLLQRAIGGAILGWATAGLIFGAHSEGQILGVISGVLFGLACPDDDDVHV